MMTRLQPLLTGWAGGVLLTSAPALPLIGSAGLAAMALLAVLLLCWRGPAPSLRAAVAGLLLGLAFASLSVQQALQRRLAPCHEGRELTVVARIDGQPLRRVVELRPRTRFRARVAQAPRRPDCPMLAGTALRLSWFDAPPLAAGELWHLRVRLRQPWGYANPGGFDYERWLLANGLAGTGTVRTGHASREAVRGALFDDWRARLRRALEDLPLRHGALLLALGSGDDSGIDAALWERLRQTGTVHLLVVSGLHVGLVAAMACGLCALLARLLALLWCRLNGVALAAVGGVLLSGLYVGLVGAEPPAVRAWLMTSVMLMARALGRRVRLWTVLLVAAGLVLAIDPLAPHRPGFWLSFGAVAVLFTLFDRRSRRPAGGPMHGWRTAALAVAGFLRAQGALAVGLSPLLALLMGSVSWISPVANALLVPPLSLLVIPLAVVGCQLAALGAPAAAVLLESADHLLEGCWRLLDSLAALDGQPLLTVASGLRTVGLLALLCAAALLVSRRWPLVLAAGWLLWLKPVDSAVPPGSFRLQALDVGQGSALLVDTARHRLLFDAGARYPGGFDLGKAVVLPALVASGPARLDRLVLSHADLDHSGGAAAVLAALRPEQVHASFRPPPGTAAPARWSDCRPGRRWRWDGVSFAFLNTLAHADSPAAADNDRSCVLLIAGDRRALLAGDATVEVEMRLGRRLREPVALLLAPHHGSLTSSSRGFVTRLRPATVFVSAGRGNRYGHPHVRVVARYRALGATVSVTGLHGALIWESWRSTGPRRWRELQAAYWRGRSRAR